MIYLKQTQYITSIMGNCIQREHIKVVDGISLNYKNIINTDEMINECYEVKNYPRTPFEDTENNYIWLSLNTSSNLFEKKQKIDGYKIASHNSLINPTSYSVNIWLRKERN